jgi:glycosyltransferase involved in cell wall biosynthesis
VENIVVSVAMATYNGDKYLREQLDSIYAQTHPKLEVIVCDDGSVDNTASILEEYKQKHGLIYKVNESNLKVVKNFEKAILQCTAPYIALSDQDDVWLPGKIEKSLKKILELELQYGAHVPLLIFTDLTVVDDNLHILHPSLWKHLKIAPKNIMFNRLLVENVITGCTILMNQTLAKLAFPGPNEIIMHDVWLGLVSSYFGHISYIPETTVLYRQHSNNTIGIKKPVIWKRLQKFLYNINQPDQYFFSNELKQAQAFKEKYCYLLANHTKQKEILSSFITCKHAGFFQRKFIILKYRFFGNTLKRTLNILTRF